MSPGTYVTNFYDPSNPEKRLNPIAMWVKGWVDPAKWGIPQKSEWVWEDVYSYETQWDSKIGIRKDLDLDGKPKWQPVYMIAQWVFGGIDVGELTDRDVAQIWTIPNARNLSVVAPKLLSATEVKDRSVLVAGVDFESELRLKPWWELEGSEPGADDQAIAGSRVATLLDLSQGSLVQVGGQIFRVVAVLAENGQQDDDMLFVDLGAAQRALDRPGAVSLVEVAALCTACPIEQMVAQIQAALPQARVTALRQAVTLRMEMVGQLMRFSWALSAVVLVIGGLVVLTTMLGAVTERKQEIGVLRAVGFRRRHIVNIILTEATLVSLLGGLLGWLTGMGAAVVLAPLVTQASLPVSWDLLLALWAVTIALVVGVAASVYPAVRAARLDPTTALRAL